jgi:hypothetical protein
MYVGQKCYYTLVIPVPVLNHVCQKLLRNDSTNREKTSKGSSSPDHFFKRKIRFPEEKPLPPEIPINTALMIYDYRIAKCLALLYHHTTLPIVVSPTIAGREGTFYFFSKISSEIRLKSVK